MSENDRTEDLAPGIREDFEAAVADGMMGKSATQTRDPKWMLRLAGIAREVGEDQALRMLANFTGHQFSEGTTFREALQDLPTIAREQALRLDQKNLSDSKSNKDIKKFPA